MDLELRSYPQLALAWRIHSGKRALLGFMTTLVTVGVLVLAALSIVCFAAYKIRAKSFEVSTSVGKVASFSIRIISADARSRESASDRVELLGWDARLSVDDEVSLPNGRFFGGGR